MFRLIKTDNLHLVKFNFRLRFVIHVKFLAKKPLISKQIYYSCCLQYKMRKRWSQCQPLLFPTNSEKHEQHGRDQSPDTALSPSTLRHRRGGNVRSQVHYLQGTSGPYFFDRKPMSPVKEIQYSSGTISIHFSFAENGRRIWRGERRRRKRIVKRNFKRDGVIRREHPQPSYD